MINVTKTHLPPLENFQFYVEQIFKSGWLTNNGTLVQELERKLADYLGVRNLLLVSNGTIALQLAYKLLGLNNDVITTPFSFVATTSSLVWEGLIPIFADIDARTLNIDPIEVEKKITSQTSGIVATHVYGNACDVEYLQFLSKRHQIPIVYDAAHTFGVNQNGESIMNYGDISTISFHSTKIFHTIEGGALVFNNNELYEKAKKMINFGIVSPIEIVELGINGKMNEFQAAMGLCMLDEMPKIFEARKKLFMKYEEQLRNIDGLEFPNRNGLFTNNYSYYPVLFPNESVLLRFLSRMNENKIFPRRYFYPALNKLPYLRTEQVMPISENVSSRVVCLPIFDGLEDSDQQSIINEVGEILVSI
ncbi:DegT/DnrJ/EryC1/StrS family aminotransferase [Cohnella sp.]|uniref:DegT/DnrJ/EryC1/StrS family aminotransferase n=1 Tax=Cohnella sp. TaxID=1883426 RepID=UPI003703825F